MADEKPIVHAVVDGQLHHVSVSQIKTFLDCPRKWVIDKVCHIKQPDTLATTAGKAAHAVFELRNLGQDYTAALTMVPEVLGQSLRLLLVDDRLPPPGQAGSPAAGILVEHPQDGDLRLSVAGTPLHGRADLLDVRATGAAKVWDLKTTGRRSGMRSKAKLATDIQLNVYAHWCYTQNPLLGEARLAHAYVLKEEAYANVVETDPVSRGHCADVFGTLEEPVRAMQKLAGIGQWQDAQPDFAACEKYGPEYRCPYYRMCHPDEAGAGDDGPDLPSNPNGPTMADMLQAHASSINPPDAAPPLTEPRPMPAPVAPTELYLYVDCHPAKLPVDAPIVFLADVVEQRQAEIARGFGVDDVRQAPFGKGVAALVNSFRMDRLFGHVVAHRTGLAGPVLEVLEMQAKQVTTGDK